MLLEFIAIIAADSITICRPIGRPLVSSARTMVQSGRYNARSLRWIHSR